MSWAAGLRLAIALGFFAVAACRDEDPVGVSIDLSVQEEAYRPSQILLRWFGPGDPLDIPYPERGSLPTTGDRLGTVFIELEPGATGRRRVLAIGNRGGMMVSMAAARLNLDAGQRQVTLVMGPRLPDSDGDGIPDLLEEDDEGGDGGAPEAGGVVEAGAARPEAGAPAAPDAGVPAPDGPPADGPPPLDTAGAPTPDGAEATDDAAAPPTDAGTDDDAGEAPPPGTLSQGLIAYWTFDDGSGTTIKDRSGNGHDAVIRPGTGSGWTTEGRKRGAYTFAGTAWAKTTTTNFDRITTAISVAGWVKRLDPQSGARSILTRQEGTTMFEHFMLGFADGRAQFSVRATAGTSRASAIAPVDQWMHVVGTYDGATRRLYVNGVEVVAEAATGMVKADRTPLTIGASLDTPDPERPETRFRGVIDELALWNRALSPGEVSVLAAGVSPL